MKQHGNIKHSFAKNVKRQPVYLAWVNMRQRCNNPNGKDYAHYGGRGITIDKDWDTFAGFYVDMGEPPKGHTLERVDNNKGYSKENCRWATRKDQSRNRAISARVTYKGVTKPVGDWADEIGMKPKNLYKRIFDRNWDVERAFTQKLKGK